MEGDCQGREPAVTVRIRRDGDDQLHYPSTLDDFAENGLAYRRVAEDVDCDTYQRLVALGAPLMDCVDCPNKIVSD